MLPHRRPHRPGCARALGAYLVVYQGGTAIGSLVWGGLAALLGHPLAILLAALGAGCGTALALSGQRKAGSETLARHSAQIAHRTSPARGYRHGADRVLHRPAAGRGLSPRHA